MLHHIHWAITERVALCWAGPLEVSSHSSFPVSVFAAHTSFLLLPGAKLVQRSSTCISLVKKILLCSTPCPAAASSFSSQAPSLADANYQLLFPAVEPSAVAGRKQMCRAFGSPGHTGHSKQLLLPGAGWWGLQGWAQQVPHHHQGHTQLGEHILWHWESSFHWPPWRTQLWGHLPSLFHKPSSKLGQAQVLFHPTLSQVCRHFCTSGAASALQGLFQNVYEGRVAPPSFQDGRCMCLHGQLSPGGSVPWFHRRKWERIATKCLRQSKWKCFIY